MRHTNKIKVFSIIAAFLIISCKKEFLETVDPNAVTNTEFWKTASDFNSGLSAAYAALQFGSVAGSGTLVDRARTDMSRSFNFYDGAWSYTTFTWSNTETYIGDRWKELYVGVFRCNQVIDNLKKVADDSDIDIDPLVADAIDGQAHFLRALYHFWIINSYSGAVIRKAVPGNNELQAVFVDKEVVLNEVIIPDLLTAISKLPEEWQSAEDLGRATKGAAHGILGKVYLFEERFEDAIAQFDTIFESGVYSLTPSIGDNFSLEGEHNEESLFEVGFSDVIAPGIHSAQQELLPNGDQSGQASGKAGRLAPQSLGGLRSIVPTFYAAELYMKDTLDVSTTSDTTRRFSDRTYWSIALANQDGDYYLQPPLEAADWFIGGAECAYWKKGSNWATLEEEDSWSNTIRSGINERILRLADVKLMYAEALIRKQGSTQDDLMNALGHVDDIRERAGVITLFNSLVSDGGLPQYHVRGDKPFKSPLVTLNHETLLEHIQKVERPLELTLEGNSIRWHDLRRWGIIEEVLTDIDAIDYNIDWMIQWVRNEALVWPIDMYNDEGFSGLEFAIDIYQNHQIDFYNPESHDYFDPPIDEVNTNTELYN